MRDGRVLDVSSLPELAFSHGASIWWGVLGLIAIEGTMFGLLAASYLYLSQVAPAWPPPAIQWPALTAATINLGVLIASLAPMIWTHCEAVGERPGRVAIGLVVCTVFCIASLVLRGFEFHALHVSWNETAYGSITWSILGMHTGHLLATMLENVLLILVMRSRRREEKHLVDVTVQALYWYFVVGAWIPLYALVFLSPRWH
jgi:heme/copper-type cytochrome/quinol oxidase subunit 3